MSGEAVGWAFRKVQIDDPTAKFVLVAICNYANENDLAWPSHNAIARLTGLARRTIQMNIKKLEDWGIIRRKRQERADGSETSAMIVLDLTKEFYIKGGVARDAIPVGKDVVPDAPRMESDDGEVWQEVRDRMATDATLETTVKPKEETTTKPQDARATRLVTAADWPENYADVFWSRYPNKKSKGHALKALDKIAKTGKTRFVDLIAGVERYILSRDVQRGFVKHPATWLNGQCWKDEEQSTPIAVGRQQSFMEVAQEAYENANGARTDHDGKW